jgi:aldose 1-epimerase
MFEYKKARIGQYHKYTFHDAKTKTGFVLIPDRGALVLEITFQGNQVLDTYTTAEEIEDLKWSKGALLFPFPNRLKDGRFTWMNKVYQWPINNVATNNAIHGMVNKVKFEVIGVTLGQYSAEVKCRYIYDGKNPAYPFPYTLDMTYGINTNNRFWVAFDVLNRCDHPIPAGFGWHPYFKLGTLKANEMQLTLTPSSQVLIDTRMIPTGQTKPLNAYMRSTSVGEAELDTCFATETEKGTYRLSLQGARQKLTLVSSAAGFPYYQVFTPPHRESIAIEPMTCNVDALNNQQGIKVIEPGGIWKDRFYLEWKGN